MIGVLVISIEILFSICIMEQDKEVYCGYLLIQPQGKIVLKVNIINKFCNCVFFNEIIFYRNHGHKNFVYYLNKASQVLKG